MIAMKKFVLFITICFCISIAAVPNDIEFVILITSYNNELYAEGNLESVAFQKSTSPYHIICVNDCSRDRTGEIMDDFVRKHKLESKITLIHNKERVGALANIYNTIHNCIADHKVVVSVDGDDRLAHNEVLLRLEEEYNKDAWMTYGRALVIPDGGKKSRRIPESIFEQGALRKNTFVANHLRTFKAGLFKKIKKEDLFYEGNFFSMTWDLAMMFPMLEMCSPLKPGALNHSTYISDILYLYNRGNPINDFKVNRNLQHKLGRYIRALPPYKPLETFSFRSLSN